MWTVGIMLPMEKIEFFFHPEINLMEAFDLSLARSTSSVVESRIVITSFFISLWQSASRWEKLKKNPLSSSSESEIGKILIQFFVSTRNVGFDWHSTESAAADSKHFHLAERREREREAKNINHRAWVENEKNNTIPVADCEAAMCFFIFAGFWNASWSERGAFRGFYDAYSSVYSKAANPEIKY